MTTQRERERAFPLSWPQWQPPGANGLAAIVAPHASTGWADGLLARDQEGLVVWAPTGSTSGEPEAQALARLQYPGVRAVTLVPARSDPRWVRLALEYALHLSGVSTHGSPTNGSPTNGSATNGSATNGSATNGARDHGLAEHGIGRACLTSTTPPTPPAGVVRIPHLATVQRDDVVTDTVVWELAPVAVAQHWLGGPLPDDTFRTFIEDHLDALLRLRAALRRGQLPARAATVGLAELLREGQLSIRFVYEHAPRFRALLSGSGHLGPQDRSPGPDHHNGHRASPEFSRDPRAAAE